MPPTFPEDADTEVQTFVFQQAYDGVELREAGGVELREDGSVELRVQDS